MGALWNRIQRDDLKTGDHIYSWRAAYIYAHHGVYVGDGKVIHFTDSEGQELPISLPIRSSVGWSAPKLDAPCEKCGDQRCENGVIISCIDCFLAEGNLCIYRYSVSPFFVICTRGGTCTLAASDPPDVVVHRAEYLLKHGFKAYGLFSNNCEDFALYCKTGLVSNDGTSRSGQVKSIKAVGESILENLPLLGKAQMTARTVAVSAALSAAMYCKERIDKDISNCSYSTKISVEDPAEASDISLLKLADHELKEPSNKLDANKVPEGDTLEVLKFCKDLKAGDHIYGWRSMHVYAHHGIYVGEGMVIHFVSLEASAGDHHSSLFSSISWSAPKLGDIPCEICGNHRHKHDNGVIMSCIDCFLCGSKPCVYLYSVPLAKYCMYRGGTCTQAASDPPEQVLHRANSLLDDAGGFPEFKFLRNNCEDFALYCKTGRVRKNGGSLSGQVQSLEAAGSAGTICLTSLAMFGLPVSIIAGTTAYCAAHAISIVRKSRSTIKVPVELPMQPATSSDAQGDNYSSDAGKTVEGCSFHAETTAEFNEVMDGAHEIPSNDVTILSNDEADDTGRSREEEPPAAGKLIIGKTAAGDQGKESIGQPLLRNQLAPSSDHSTGGSTPNHITTDQVQMQHEELISNDEAMTLRLGSSAYHENLIAELVNQEVGKLREEMDDLKKQNIYLKGYIDCMHNIYQGHAISPLQNQRDPLELPRTHRGP